MHKSLKVSLQSLEFCIGFTATRKRSTPPVFKSTNLENHISVRVKNWIDWAFTGGDKSIKFLARTVAWFSRFVLLKILGMATIHLHHFSFFNFGLILLPEKAT